MPKVDLRLKEIGFTPKERIHFQLDKRPQGANYTWFRGEHCNFNPQLKNLRSPRDVVAYLLQGWLPAQPLIGPETRVSAFGSCFAQHISDWLVKRNYSILTRKDGDYDSIYVVRFGEGMVNTFALRQQFEWAYEGKRFEGELWHGYDARAYGYDEEVRAKTRAVFDQTDVFVITLGLSEVWYDDQSGGVLWRAVPRDKYDPSRHKFRVSSVQENTDNIRAIYDLVSKYRPAAKIIFTLSPIPLVATFRPVSCITANSVSKAILRASLDEVLREVQPEGRAFYWPSYEIIMELFDHRWLADRRHVKREILALVMTFFEAFWCHGKSQLTLEEAWARARVVTYGLPRVAERVLVRLAGWWARARVRALGSQGVGSFPLREASQSGMREEAPQT